MFSVKINKMKNVVLCVFSGVIDEEQAKAVVQKFKEAIDLMEPGFKAINDIREMSPAPDNIHKIIGEGADYAVKMKMGMSVRVVKKTPGSTVSNIKFNQKARKLGYESRTVNTMEEAKRIVGL